MSIASISVWDSYQGKRAEHDITSDAAAVALDPVDLVGAELLPVPAPHCDTVVAQSPDVEALPASDTVPVALDHVDLVCAPLMAMPSFEGDDLIVFDVPTAPVVPVVAVAAMPVVACRWFPRSRRQLFHM